MVTLMQLAQERGKKKTRGILVITFNEKHWSIFLSSRISDKNAKHIL
jgi:flagellar biosynthesis regulator FlaF